MVKAALDANYWENRYQTGEIGWDLGSVSPPLKNYFDQLENKKIRILIPGCGNAYEAEYLHQQGFPNVYLVDLSASAIESFLNRNVNFPKNHCIHGNFFDLEEQFDLVVEQTFFCAINPKLRSAYAKKMHEILVPNGKLVGLLFNIPLNTEHPPFGGHKDEYIAYFKPYFELKSFEMCYNSIGPRSGNELFMIFKNL